MDLVKNVISIGSLSYYFVSFLISFLAAYVVITGFMWFFKRIKASNGKIEKTSYFANSFQRQAVILLVILGSIISIIFILPLAESTQNQVLTLLGLILTAIVTLSSTTIAANVMASIMLRIVKSFRPGDFIKIEGHFGRITESGLLHTEIQTEDRDLVTISNLYLVQRPYTITRATGTMISSTLSLGYDVHHETIKGLLLGAAKEAGLTDAYVLIISLGDFSVSYRVSGLLTDVKQLLSTRSKLNEAILVSFHSAGIEIISPSFMNQRKLDDRKKVIPTEARIISEEISDRDIQPLEELVFDKAEEAEKREELKKELEKLTTEMESLDKDIDEASEETLQSLNRRKAMLQQRSALIKDIIASMEREKKEKN